MFFVIGFVIKVWVRTLGLDEILNQVFMRLVKGKIPFRSLVGSLVQDATRYNDGQGWLDLLVTLMLNSYEIIYIDMQAPGPFWT